MTTTPDFNLGDFIETLPYEDGPGSPDEYISNALIIKRLQLRNEELKEEMLKLDKRYISSSDASHYIGISRRANFNYSIAIDELECDLKALQARIKARKSMEVTNGKAKAAEPTNVLQVRTMTGEILERINAGNDLLHPENEDDL